jgi:hypothetical protein
VEYYGVVELLLIKEQMKKWKIECLEMVKNAVPSLLEREKEGEAEEMEVIMFG